jgi:hypothetical protein
MADLGQERTPGDLPAVNGERHYPHLHAKDRSRSLGAFSCTDVLKGSFIC